mmetsp:Transcript_27780/g.42072  ORF Transcript_27780/g.42072 Transcript_27780/m.42072 type:complete len:92 (+) Transcript_27780:133-408(+)|eukprot:CAMPEP_0194765238 /NCGR_PEP_ID=MMETSP0323_2-20130528/25567_1 /TAXON_ID=2866 ORGANISM="Crypthecodinium cohnii, Strain Seligo" /NCGR_SAMPLE_ID=MMETSP0323_2 /ASSEMBLY_ACC=CAM_ASM_000346 /LENGTH=91 /DNA_ID=CAMNT_0039694231 /DNA_START=71 /DNA_END=346 /DNA_ORIENTATION=+
MTSEAAQTVEHDIGILIEGLNRLGTKESDGTRTVNFGVVFKDETLEQQLETLVGSLKAAKKRGMLDFKGQMLLQGVHDNVVITLAKDHVTE